ncbi:LysR family transcriptional regulator [Fodinicola feengrottensis]|uniref:LysR family transcriptional regulator n=1 Tax=Fodinicola feengrottensis TaxID=435914 RepID=UPI0013D5FC84|nr:LysR family transcriptional regulator [Fodinicola feengrottensis]
METRRLRLLLELSRLGSMREVSDVLGVTTSTVSQQIAVLGREVGADLIEPDGRRVRLTPAGRRLADHAVKILAAVEAAYADLDPGAEPTGCLRVAGYVTAIRRFLLPIVADLAVTHPKLELLMYEHEPVEAFTLLAADDLDLALVYDYTLVPASIDATVELTPLHTASWGLGVPAESTASGNALAVFGQFRDESWIVNSRNTADENVVRAIASLAGFEPRIAHYIDGLELVQELIVAGLGVGLLPIDWPTLPGVRLLPLAEPAVTFRSYAAIRQGRGTWPPLALLLARLRAAI